MVAPACSAASRNATITPEVTTTTTLASTAGAAWELDSYTATSYDALNRVTQVAQMSQGSTLYSSTTQCGTASNLTWVKATDPEGRWSPRPGR